MAHSPQQLHDRAAELDAADPLAHHRAAFVAAPEVRAYLDGNSLGRPLVATRERLTAFVDGPWGARLIQSWDEGWMDVPTVLGDRIGRIALGAGPGQTVVADSTTVLLYKLVRAAVDALAPGRDEIVAAVADFPTDRFVLEGVAAERGASLRWLPPRPDGVDAEQVRAVVGDRTALVLLSHVDYRSGRIADLDGITRAAHDAGALVLWDLSHSAGCVDVDLDRHDVDLAVGCSYKYLNGGPGAPAFAYVASRLQPALHQPIQGWMGSAEPFAMGETYVPAAGVRRVLSGTPPILAMQPLHDMLDLLEPIGLPAVRAKSIALTSFALEVHDAALAPLGVSVASPRDASLRGGHVTFEHPGARAAVQTLWQRGVVPDFRHPHGVRVGLSPLSTGFAELLDGLLELASVLDAR